MSMFLVLLIPLLLLLIIIGLAIWRSNLSTQEEIEKAKNPKAVPIRGSVFGMWIARSKRKTIIDVLGVFIGVVGAFIGLSISIALNNAKTKADNKERLLKILQYYGERQDDCAHNMKFFQAKMSDSVTKRLAKYSEITWPYPYFSSITDPVVYDISPPTRAFLIRLTQMFALRFSCSTIMKSLIWILASKTR